MEYLFGSLVTLITILIINKIVLDKIRDYKQSDNVIRYSQSHLFNLMKPALSVLIEQKPRLMTQTTKFEASNYVKVIIVEEQAYWIRDNTFFVADMEDGLINKDSTRKVDTMAMDKVQLDRIIFIVDTLTEGVDDDYWDSGNKQL